MLAKNRTATPLNILVYSLESLTIRHGSGSIFARDFKKYPRTLLFQVCRDVHSESIIAQASTFSVEEAISRAQKPFVFLNRLIWNVKKRIHAFTALDYLSLIQEKVVVDALGKVPFAPDIIYAICMNLKDLRHIRLIAKSFGGKIPLVVVIYDFFPAAAFGFWREFKKLDRYVSAYRVISEPIASALKRQLGRKVVVEMPFAIESPAQFKRTYELNPSGFQPILLGNIWQPELLQDLSCIWRQAKEHLPNLLPYAWHCHSASAARLEAAGASIGPEFSARPFLQGERLFAALQKADLAIIPFSRSSSPQNDYERYSLPSRITEFCAAGLPMLALAGPETPLAHMINKLQIGKSTPASDYHAASRLLLAFSDSEALRASLGKAARRFSIEHMNISKRRADLFSWLYAVASDFNNGCHHTEEPFYPAASSYFSN